jgi:hypothetical protein
MLTSLQAFKTGSATVSSTAKAITHTDFAFSTAELSQAASAIIGTRTGGVMMMPAGLATPTATVGYLIPAGGYVTVEGSLNISGISLIREGSTDATVTITLEK